MRRKRFNTHARMLPSPRFSVASAFVPHLCFLSLLCYVRILLVPFHCPFSLLSLLTPFLCLLGVLFCSVFSDFPHLLCYLCFFSNFPVFPASSVSLLSLFTLLRPLSLLHPHSTRPISSSLFSVISIDPFSLFARSPLLLCFL